MKKLTLALALALGVANVNANPVVPAMNAEEDLHARIRSANFSDQEKTTVMEWVKDHKLATAGIALAIIAATGGAAAGLDIWLNDGTVTAKCCDFVAANGGTWTSTKATAAKDW